jgi:hypothetical protein
MKFIFLLAILTVAFSQFLLNGNTYQVGDNIPVIIDKVWPKGNPSETYDYFSLPFCPFKDHLGETFAYSITGSRQYVSRHELSFSRDSDAMTLCPKRKYSSTEIDAFIKAIDRDYYFLMHIDDLPIRDHLGQKRLIGKATYQYVLFTHLELIFTHNKGQVISVALGKKFNPFELRKGAEMDIEFTYSVKWTPTEAAYSNRLEKYNEANQYPDDVEIQWFSIVNSLVLVCLLTCFLAFILLRILNRDIQKYTDPEDKEESGWKYIHADVFRFPANTNFLSALLGNGSQLISMTLLVLMLAIMGIFTPDYSYRAMYTAIIIVYVLTTGINGFVSGWYYKQFGGENWVSNVFLSTLLFVGPLFGVWSILNTIALIYGSTAAIQFKYIIMVLALYMLISFPLALIGAIAAKNIVGPFQAPCRTKQVAREIPPVPFYKNGISQFVIAGFLPFSAIYVELYYVFISLWGNTMYTPYIILGLVFVVLIMVTSCITVAMTYLQVSQEDFHWWWRSVISGGATSFFILGYSVLFYFESSMEGVMQMCFFFGYTMLTCWGFFLMLSTVGFFSSMAFVKSIYGAIKID